MDTSPHITQNVEEMISMLAREAHKLNWPASEEIMKLNAKVQQHGAQAITPVEAIWISTLVAERFALQMRERMAGAISLFS